MRSGRLSPHLAVTWVFAEIAALFTFFLWQWTPIFKITSKLADREILMLLSVLFFGAIVFLMLDSIVRISKQSQQIKVLTQEIALLRQELERSS
jgi:hypothetical protein